MADALSDEPADTPAQVRQPVPAGELSDGDVVVSDEGQGMYLGGGLALVNGQRVSLSSLTNPSFYRAETPGVWPSRRTVSHAAISADPLRRAAWEKPVVTSQTVVSQARVLGSPVRVTPVSRP